MSKTLIALYEDIPTADKVLRDLQNNGFDPETMSVLAHNSVNLSDPYREVTTAEGRDFGAIVGGITGLLAGLVMITIPGIGSILAAGPLALILGSAAGTAIGASAGALTGGLSAALANMNVSKHEADHYIERMLEGNVIVTVEVSPDTVDAAIPIMSKYLPIDIQYRVEKLSTDIEAEESDSDATIGLNREVESMGRLVR